MAVNRFSTPAEAQYKPTVMRIPFEELLHQGRIMQDNYDLGVSAKQSFLEKLAKSEFREEDRADFERINQKYEQGLNQIAEEVGRDYGSNSWKEKFDTLARTLQADFTQGDLYAMQKNADALKEWNKRKADFKESPYKEYLDESFQSVGNYKGYRNPDGSYNITSVGNIDKFLERDKKADEIVKGIAANGWGGFKTGTDEHGNTIIVDSKGEAVSPEKISKTFLPLFTNSEEFGQMQKEAQFLAQTQGVDPNEYLKQSVGELLSGVTAKYGYYKTSSSMDINRLPEHQSKKADESLGNDYEETAGTEYTPEIIPDRLLRKQGKNNQLYTYNPGSGGAMTPAGKQVYKEMPPEDKAKFTKIVKSFKPDADEAFLKSDAAYEIVRKYNDELKANKIVDKTPIITSDFIRRGEDGRSTREDATKDLASNWKYRTFYDIKTGEKISGSDPDFLEKMGYEGKDAVKKFEEDLKVTGEYSPKNRFTKITKSEAFVDPMAVVVNGKELAVSRSKGELSGNSYLTHKVINDVFNAFHELPGIDNEVKIQGITFKTSTKNGTYELIDPDGEVIPLRDLEDAPQALYEHYSKKQTTK